MGDLGSIPGLGRFSGEGNGHLLQYSGLENSTDFSPHGRKELDTTERLSLSLLNFWGFYNLYYFKENSVNYKIYFFKTFSFRRGNRQNAF